MSIDENYLILLLKEKINLLKFYEIPLMNRKRSMKEYSPENQDHNYKYEKFKLLFIQNFPYIRHAAIISNQTRITIEECIPSTEVSSLSTGSVVVRNIVVVWNITISVDISIGIVVIFYLNI
jgi:hypothetical protein